jgi:hypothetical protein
MVSISIPGSSLPLLHFHLHFVPRPPHYSISAAAAPAAPHIDFHFILWPPLRPPLFSILGQPHPLGGFSLSSAFPPHFPLPPFQFYLALAVRFFVFLFIHPSKHF